MATHTVPRHVLEALAHLARTPFVKPSDPAGLIGRIVQAGSASEDEIETLLRDLEPRRVPGYRNFAEWPPLLGFPYVPLAFQPSRGSNGAGLFDRLPAAHLAAFLVTLERFGLPIDPGPLVESLLPSIRAKPFVDIHELTLLWYAQTRHKGGGETLLAEEPAEGDASSSTHRLANRYKVTVHRRGDAVVAVEVALPGRMREVKLVQVHCPHCMTTYHRGDVDSVHMHRLEHARCKPAFDPTPARALLALPPGPARGLVTWRSPTWMQNAVYKRAVLFRRDQRYDFVQWSESGEHDPDVEGYLFEDDSGTFPPGTIVGATCFRKRSGRWEMDWAWLCPGARRKGILSRRWPWFRERYGDFGLTFPLSDAMKAFVAARDPSAELV